MLKVTPSRFEDPTADSLCAVCDARALEDAPLPLCTACLQTAYRFGGDYLPITAADLDRIRDPCPICGLTALIHNRRTGEVWCVTEMGGCGTSVPLSFDARETLRREIVRRTQSAALTAKRDLIRSVADADQSNAGKSCVYYIRMGDQIKIGVSINPASRARTLSLTPAHIQATEPGTNVLEHMRHQQFAHLRVHGEWFHAGEDLLEHIEKLKAEAAA